MERRHFLDDFVEEVNQQIEQLTAQKAEALELLKEMRKPAHEDFPVKGEQLYWYSEKKDKIFESFWDERTLLEGRVNPPPSDDHIYFYAHPDVFNQPEYEDFPAEGETLYYYVPKSDAVSHSSLSEKDLVETRPFLMEDFIYFFAKPSDLLDRVDTSHMRVFSYPLYRGYVLPDVREERMLEESLTQDLDWGLSHERIYFFASFDTDVPEGLSGKR